MRWKRASLTAHDTPGEGFVGPVGGQGYSLHRAVIVQSHRRSGTHFLIDTLRSRFPVARDWFHLEEDFYARLVSAPVVLKSHDFVWREKLASELPWHSFLHWVAASACHDGAAHIHIMRNPRDVLRSLYYFDLKGHEPRYHIASDTPFSAYLARPAVRAMDGRMTPIEMWCAHMAAWLSRPDVLQVRYEDLLQSLDTELLRIGVFLGMADHGPRWRESSAIGRSTSARLAKRMPAPWTGREERALLRAARHYGLPDLGYGLDPAVFDDRPP
ncbi:MAG: sulfotransferase domain-containing protein, partial [Pseudomonadota bacterium]